MRQVSQAGLKQHVADPTASASQMLILHVYTPPYQPLFLLLKEGLKQGTQEYKKKINQLNVSKEELVLTVLSDVQNPLVKVLKISLF